MESNIDRNNQIPTIDTANSNDLEHLVIKVNKNILSGGNGKIESASIDKVNLETVDLIKSNIAGSELTEKILYCQQLLDERDKRIENYIREIDRLNLLSNEIKQEINRIYLSKSWRITKPLRILAQKKLQPFKFLYRCIRMLAKLCTNIVRARNINKLWLRTGKSNPPVNSLLLLENVSSNILFPPQYLGVHIYIKNSEHLDEIFFYLKNIPIKFSLYITTDCRNKIKLIESKFSKINNYCRLERIVVYQPIAGEIFSMFSAFKDELNQHEIILHLHTQFSISGSWALETGCWRRFLMESLLGDSQYINVILEQFIHDKELSAVFPQPYQEIKTYISKQENLYIQQFSSVFKKDSINEGVSSFGGMFWFRSKLIEQISQMLSPIEKHEIIESSNNLKIPYEEVFPVLAARCGMQTKPYSLTSFLSPESHAHQFNLLRVYLDRDLIKNAIIFFDHNLGGGTNIYTRAYIKEAFGNDFSIIRIYNFQGIWFVQWLENNDGMLFYTKYFEELFNTLYLIPAANIVVNSLYGFPKIGRSISNIIALTKKLNIPLEIKMHDFFALCPSPHLVNVSGQYCEVPQDAETCRQCLKNNLSWYPSWYPQTEQPVDIKNWRQPFLDLLTAASLFTFFDSASIEIFRRAFHIDEHKIRITPHNTDYFIQDKPVSLLGPLHIGILGTLNSVKGSKIVEGLADYITNNNLPAKITVVGPSVELPPEITIYGPYEPNELPSIIEKNGVNVILAPSIVPETFGYTISEAMKMRLPIVAFDLGAQGNRVKHYKWGKVIPLGSSAEIILHTLESVLKLAKGTI